MRLRHIAFLLPVSVLAPCVCAQIVITEVMSSSSTTHGGNPVPAGPDYFEISNYGTQAVDLAGWMFNDNTGGLGGADPRPFESLVIQGGQSLVFVQMEEPQPGMPSFSEDSFRERWGLAPSVPVIPYVQNGFSSAGDEVWLWRPHPEIPGEYQIVDVVQFGSASRGRSWTYDPIAGVFGALSTEGIDGGRMAAGSDDVGSPGVPPRPIPMGIVVQPRSILANAGDKVVLRIEFKGLPKPRCQWFFNDGPMPVGTGPELTLTNIRPSQAGRYHAVLDNGRSLLASAPATVALRQQPVPPSWLQLPRDLSLFPGQGGWFEAIATGVPQPEYRWWHGGETVPGATAGGLRIDAAESSDAGEYTVVASNPSGAITNRVWLKVTPRPRLFITEVMSAPAPVAAPAVHEDWLEISNLDSEAVDLAGYRFDDGSDVAVPSLGSAWTFPHPLILRPGESMILVENMSADAFRDWWGPENLPPDLQIVTYRGAALSLNGSSGDVVWLWNPGAESDTDYLVGVDFVGSEPGRTFAYDPGQGRFIGTRAGLSRDGVNGAFTAAVGGDVGSPGHLSAPPLRVLSCVREGAGFRLVWRTEAGRRYRVFGASRLDAPDWQPLTPALGATGSRFSHWVADEPGLERRFYRVQVEGDAR